MFVLGYAFGRCCCMHKGRLKLWWICFVGSVFFRSQPSPSVPTLVFVNSMHATSTLSLLK